MYIKTKYGRITMPTRWMMTKTPKKKVKIKIITIKAELCVTTSYRLSNKLNKIAQFMVARNCNCVIVIHSNKKKPALTS